MVVAKRLIKKKSATSHKKKSSVGLGLSLPTEPHVPTKNLQDYTWMFIGVKKIGKTSLAVQFEGSLLFKFEPGGKSLPCYQVSVPTWDHFREYVRLMKVSKKYKLAVIDTATIAYDRNLEYVCRKNNIVHPGAVDDYGTSWSKVRTEFEAVHGQIFSQDMGLIVITHLREVTAQTRGGNKFSKSVPALSSQADEFYAGVIDNIIYYERDEFGKPWMTIRAYDDYIVAGTRCTENFFTPNGKPIYRIPAGKSAKEAYRNLVRAFNNQQLRTYLPGEEETDDTKVKRKKFRKNT